MSKASRNAPVKELKSILGSQEYSALIQMLKAIGPDARTHRISVVIAAMLRFTRSKLPAHCEDGTLGQALLTLEEKPHLATEQSEEYDLVFDLIDQLCREARMKNLRTSARGDSYSIAENVMAEYIAWYNMPWED
jgi:hypothetical protein